MKLTVEEKRHIRQGLSLARRYIQYAERILSGESAREREDAQVCIETVRQLDTVSSQIVEVSRD